MKYNIKKNVTDFLYEEEGNISRERILTVGSLLLIVGILYAEDVFATHYSHSSHSSHRSHSSHSSHRSHSSHSNYHSSHSSHSNHSSLPTFYSPKVPQGTPVIK